MKCDCYDNAYWPVIDLLKQASGVMWYRTPEYDFHQQMMQNMIVQLNKKFRCINEDCYTSNKPEPQTTDENDGEE